MIFKDLLPNEKSSDLTSLVEINESCRTEIQPLKEEVLLNSPIQKELFKFRKIKGFEVVVEKIAETAFTLQDEEYIKRKAVFLCAAPLTLYCIRRIIQNLRSLKSEGNWTLHPSEIILISGLVSYYLTSSILIGYGMTLYSSQGIQLLNSFALGCIRIGVEMRNLPLRLFNLLTYLWEFYYFKKAFPFPLEKVILKQ